MLVVDARSRGGTYESIGRDMDISPERVRQILCFAERMNLTPLAGLSGRAQTLVTRACEEIFGETTEANALAIPDEYLSRMLNCGQESIREIRQWRNARSGAAPPNGSIATGPTKQSRPPR